jgi:hypothetical protein
MREQMPNGYAVLVATGEFREVLRNRSVQLEFALIEEEHRGRGGRDDLREGRQIVDGPVGADGGTSGAPIQPAEALLEDRVTVASYNDCRTWKASGIEAASHNAVNCP